MLISTKWQHQQFCASLKLRRVKKVIPFYCCCSSNSRSLQKCLLLIYLIYVSSATEKFSFHPSHPHFFLYVWHWKLLLCIYIVRVENERENSMRVFKRRKLTNNFVEEEHCLTTRERHSSSLISVLKTAHTHASYY